MKYEVKEIPMDYVLEHLAYDENSPSGLIWIKRPYKTRCVVGSMAGSLLNKNKLYNGKTYWQLKIGKKVYKVHRVVWALLKEEPDENLVIDHIDGDGLNNRIDNLRLVNFATNGVNRPVNKERMLTLPKIVEFEDIFLARFSHKGKNYKLRTRKEHYASNDLAIEALVEKIIKCKQDSLHREISIDKVSIDLTEELKQEIYSQVCSGKTQAEVARQYNIGSSTVNRIVKKYKNKEI